MGARLTNLQPPQTAWLKDRQVTIKTMRGETLKIYIALDLEFSANAADYLDENVLVKFEEYGLILVMRKNRTWSLIDKETTMLLDMGTFVLDQKYTIEKYALIGYMTYNGLKSAISLDLTDKRFIHGMKGAKLSNGHDFEIYNGEDIDLDKIDLPNSYASATVYPYNDLKFHILTMRGEEVNVHVKSHMVRNISL